MILAAARQLFASDGFDNTSVDAIAARAEVSKATVYAYFASKERLFQDTLDAMIGEMPDRWDARSGAGGTLQARLTVVAHDIVEMMAGPMFRGMHRMLVLSRRFTLQGADSYWDVCFERYDSVMQRFLLAETRRGTLAIPDVAQASAQFFGLVAGAPTLRALFTGAPFAQERPAAMCMDSAVTLFVRGYQPAASPQSGSAPSWSRPSEDTAPDRPPIG